MVDEPATSPIPLEGAPAAARDQPANKPTTNGDPPKWFKSKDYSYLFKLTVAEWLHELQRCNHLLSGDDLTEWESIGPKEDVGWTKKMMPAFIGPPVVQIVNKADQAELLALEKPALIVQVYLAAPDGTIIEEFKKALRAARRDLPEPVKKPGPQATRAQFTKQHFTRWQNHRIVALCELDAWRRTLPENERPRDADFGRWLFPTYADTDKTLADARKTLHAALASIPALWAQTEGKASVSLPTTDSN
jgi:hypothetical protein